MMNAVCAHLKRTIQKQFVDFYEDFSPAGGDLKKNWPIGWLNTAAFGHSKGWDYRPLSSRIINHNRGCGLLWTRTMPQ